MKSIKELYPYDGKYGDKWDLLSDSKPYGYDEIIRSMEYEIQVKSKDNGYSGDSFYILRNNLGDWGFLTFGWGSCSGCDALLACETHEELEELRADLNDSIKWFDSKKTLQSYFDDKDWETEWFGRDTTFYSFKDLVMSL